MKFLIVLLICIGSSFRLFSQSVDTTSESKETYLNKSRSQKTTAWIFLGTGAAALTTGLIVSGSVSNDSDLYSDWDQIGAGGILATLGAAAGITSIPFFVASSKNKRRAMAISSGSQQIMTPVKGGWAYNIQPAIKITVPIGH